MRRFLSVVGLVAVAFWAERSLAILPTGRILAGAVAPSLCVLAGTGLPLRQAVAVGLLLGLSHDLDRAFLLGFGPATLVPVVFVAAALSRRVRAEHALAPVALGAVGALAHQALSLLLLVPLRLPLDPMGSLGLHLLAGGVVTLVLWRPWNAFCRWSVGPAGGEAASL